MADPVVDIVAMNAVLAANGRQAAVTQDLRRREESIREALIHIAAELRATPTAARCCELAAVIERLARRTKRHTKLLQHAAARAARI